MKKGSGMNIKTVSAFIKICEQISLVDRDEMKGIKTGKQ
jgi:hypothetical protein